MKRGSNFIHRLGALLLTLVAGNVTAVDFETNIRPLLTKHCAECHGAKKQKADLRLDVKAHALKGGESGAVIVPGDSAKSLLYQRVISEQPDEQMPPRKSGRALTPAEIAVLKAWLDAGAVWPENAADKAASLDARRQHWALQPVKAAANPKASVDWFIDEKLKAAGLQRSPAADARTLIRRLYLDVIGLAPTPEEVEEFARQFSPSGRSEQAIAALVDKLLASPRFGERWARHWLDVVRFAESDGFEMNRARANSWPYRDYVIKAFNDDKPYDQFVREQLAGDAFGADAATGFLVGGAKDRVGSRDPVLTANQRADELHDMVSTTAATFLGLTLNCARCHDHKFDPVSTQDYYGLAGILFSSHIAVGKLIADDRLGTDLVEVSLLNVEQTAQNDRLDEAAAQLDTLRALDPTDPATTALATSLAALRRSAGASPPAR